MFQEAREGVYSFGAELLGRLGRGGEVGYDGGERVVGEVLHEFVSQTKNQNKSALGCVAAGSLKGLDAREERGLEEGKNAPLFARRDYSARPCR